MNRRQALILLLLAAASALAAFYGRRIMTGPCESGRRNCWIDSNDSETGQLQDQLELQTQEILTDLNMLRQDLCRVVADPCQPDSSAIDKLVEVNAAHRKLVVTIFDHITDLRDALPQQQKERLMKVCSELLAQPKLELTRRSQNRHRHQGGGRGGDNSRGFRRQARGGCLGIDERLGLTDEQKQAFGDLDPEFMGNSKRLTGELLGGIDNLRVLIDNGGTGKEEILQSVEQILKIQAELELCTLKHLLTIKPHLNIDQRDILKTMCSKCVCRSQEQ